MILTLRQAAAHLQIAVKTCGALARRGQIPAFKLGRQWRFVREELDSFAAEQARENKKQCPSQSVRAPSIGRSDSRSLGSKLDGLLRRQAAEPHRSWKSNCAVISGARSGSVSGGSRGERR
ncbi:MAG: helix-turn-helix domain-containing protein [Steroidobacteraceae bacterium]